MTSMLADDSIVPYLAAIVRRREHVGLTQAEFGKKIGLGQSRYSQLESGSKEMTLVQYVLIARALDTTVAGLAFDVLDRCYKDRIGDIVARIRNHDINDDGEFPT